MLINDLRRKAGAFRYDAGDVPDFLPGVGSHRSTDAMDRGRMKNSWWIYHTDKDLYDIHMIYDIHIYVYIYYVYK